MTAITTPHLPDFSPCAELEIHALGQARVLFRGKVLALSQRQMEILCILALHPAGMSRDALHQALYADANHHPTTLKTVLTQLRHVLTGQIGSHPYRLLIPVWADFLELPRYLQQHDLVNALRLYQGALLVCSTAPALEVWRYRLDAGMGLLLRGNEDAGLLIRHASNLLCTPLVRERLLELLVEV